MTSKNEINHLNKKHKINNPFLRMLMLKTIGLFKPSFIYKNRTFIIKMMPKNSVCTEVGVYVGDNSATILKVSKPKKLFLIDSWEKVENNKNYSQDQVDRRYEFTKKRFENNPNVKIIRGESLKTLESFPDNYFDWVYLDDNHFTEHVIKELKICFNKVKTNGYITGDDCEFGKTENPTHKLVSKAIKKFINEETNVKLILVKHCQFILQVKKQGSNG